ncbi:DivIVA domain-containing protein [Bifidobacterium cuniculi]|uniref:DivIVA domain containing protein n=1 Tax=Bifidobacterium cuniculi TaxID=1688 RepID=A0A087ARQ9_9BIFI|nr:DivIVA domain-containing protein [Bifidobacterium cuniculi]KFI61459.1 DivIVA domain containing protein [Bifidobacterium cuniculi]
MAQQTDADSGKPTIARVSKRKKGYDVRQVDAFLEQAHALYDSDDMQLKRQDIQDASFDIVKGGYAIPQVDAALERLERAVGDKQTSYDIAELGRVAWKAQAEAQFRALEEHAARASGERFAPGKPKVPSYDRKQVDRLIDRIMAKAEFELECVNADRTYVDNPDDPDPQVTAKSVSDVTFTQRVGKHGYDERQVDYYLNACVDLLGRLESYARIADYVKPSASHAASADGAVPQATAAAAQTQVIAPLILGDGHKVEPAPVDFAAASAVEEFTAVPAGDVPGTDDANASFDEVAQAEQAIFTGPIAIPVADADADDAQGPQAAAETPAPAYRPIVEPTSAVAQTHTLSDIKPITPAPRTIPAHEQAAQTAGSMAETGRISAVPAVTAISDETTVTVPEHAMGDDFQSPSLAALASMAQVSSEPTVEPAPTGPIPLHGLAVPKLSALSIPDLPMPVRHDQPADGTGAGTDDAAAADETAATPSLESEIPDLSFPTISTDEPLIIDDKPNQRYHG